MVGLFPLDQHCVGSTQHGRRFPRRQLPSRRTRTHSFPHFHYRFVFLSSLPTPLLATASMYWFPKRHQHLPSTSATSCSLLDDRSSQSADFWGEVAMELDQGGSRVVAFLLVFFQCSFSEVTQGTSHLYYAVSSLSLPDF